MLPAERRVDPVGMRAHDAEGRVDGAAGSEPEHAVPHEPRADDGHRGRGETAEVGEPVERLADTGRSHRSRERGVDEHERVHEVRVARREPDGERAAHRVAHEHDRAEVGDEALSRRPLAASVARREPSAV